MSLSKHFELIHLADVRVLKHFSNKNFSFISCHFYLSLLFSSLSSSLVLSFVFFPLLSLLFSCLLSLQRSSNKRQRKRLTRTSTRASDTEAECCHDGGLLPYKIRIACSLSSRLMAALSGEEANAGASGAADSSTPVGASSSSLLWSSATGYAAPPRSNR